MEDTYIKSFERSPTEYRLYKRYANGKYVLIKDESGWQLPPGGRKGRPVEVDGYTFPSIKAAADHYNVHSSTIYKWSIEGKKARRPSYYYVVDGVRYETAREVGEVYGFSTAQAVIYRCINQNWTTWHRYQYE